MITPQCKDAEIIRNAKIIIWDEASMISVDQIMTVDRTLRDIMKVESPLLKEVPLGGKLFVFGGDFRQVLPVIPRAQRPAIVSQCLNNSPLWPFVKTLRLHANMRVQQALSADNPQLAEALHRFSLYLLRIGDGKEVVIDSTSFIRLDDEMILQGSNISTLANAVYNNFQNPNDLDADTLVSKAILAPKNTQVSEINSVIMDQFPGEFVEYLSADKVEDVSLSMLYPTEFLNSLNPGSLPPHCLKLKVGSPIMMLRNLSPKDGVCNGTRMICRSFKSHIIEAEIATGPNKEATFLIPRIDVISNEVQTTIPFKRRQFPIRPAFAMTINKAQGQTLDSVGLFLTTPVFSHGQLYVAFSRIKQPSSIKILLDRQISTIKNHDGLYTENIVFNEVFK